MSRGVLVLVYFAQCGQKVLFRNAQRAELLVGLTAVCRGHDVENM